VRSLEAAGQRLCRLFDYRPATRPVINAAHQVEVQFFQKPGSIDIKLIAPAGENSPLAGFLRSKGEGLHHIAFKADDVRRAIASLEEQGARITAAPAPGEAFDGGLIGFAYAGFGLNVEVIDTDQRRSVCGEPSS
jgi:catechol 2,3-dioxygenase-like lactoylglutathione lyase family enzyme